MSTFPQRAMATVPIQDYAVIGDCRSAALISKHGSVDWLCWPRFDSPSLFGALLDAKNGGRWSLRPRAPSAATHRYLPDTNILETRFRTASGLAVLEDWMPAADESEKASRPWPEHELLRSLRCEAGEVTFELDLDARPRYGRSRPRHVRADAWGVYLECDHALLTLGAEVRLSPTATGAHAHFTLRAGERARFSLAWSQEAPGVLLPLGARVDEDRDRTASWWRRWAGRARYQGPHREAVVRSALVLKLLSFAPSGAIVAAPTTSLPEQPGGALNWDYRYCWLRDASLTVRALYGLGYSDEANAFVDWLLQSTRLSWPRLRTLYDVYGNSPGRERELSHWSGYGGARPVRVRNAADEQLQLDVYGEVVEAAAQLLLRGGELDHETQHLLGKLGTFVAERWRSPDNGIWESRHGRRPYTFSRLMCWVALDRLLELDARAHLRSVDVHRLRAARHAIRKAIEDEAWNPRLGCYTQATGGTHVDASLLLMPWYGFTSAEAVRMRMTWHRIQQRLGAGGPLLYRYASRSGEAEGAFGVCSFWGVEYLALGGGSTDEARDAFERMVSLSNDVGLYAEEIDPESGDALGNFPQAFTHIGLINAALTLERRIQTGERGSAWIGAHAARAGEAPP